VIFFIRKYRKVWINLNPPLCNPSFSIFGTWYFHAAQRLTVSIHTVLLQF
jgi:hypothetical protein